MNISACPKKWMVTIGAGVHELTMPQIKELQSKLAALIHSEECVDPVLRLIAEKFKLPVERILSRERTDELCRARWCMMHLLNRRGYNYSEIARRMKLDCGTVAHGLSVLKTRMEINKDMARVVAFLEEQAA